jgi:hypothetical protein
VVPSPRRLDRAHSSISQRLVEARPVTLFLVIALVDVIRAKRVVVHTDVEAGDALVVHEPQLLACEDDELEGGLPN